MEELLELEQYLRQGDYESALNLTLYLQEMSRDDKINAISSFCVVLLTHLIKQRVEGRLTNSWRASINNSVREIKKRNKRRKSGGYYLTKEELREALEDAYLNAIACAALEVEVEGQTYNSEQLFQRMNSEYEELIDEALALIHQ